MNPNASPLERVNTWAKTSITLKLLSIGFLMFILLIPATMIQFVIQERKQHKSNVVREISSKWGNNQTVVGPVLTVPYKKLLDSSTEDDPKIVTKYAHFLPDDLLIKGEVIPQVRYRSIYKAVLYNTKLNISGHFSKPELTANNIAEILWEDAFVAMGIPDMRGINENIRLQWDSTQFLFEPGVQHVDVFDSGVSVATPLDSTERKERYNFSCVLDLNGSVSLNFVPLGKETNVELQSEWANPSFQGAFLPDERTIDETGFQAKWKVLHLNRNFPQQWIGNSYNVYESDFGLHLVTPVDGYQKNMRSSKYAGMFIFLTFLVFFFVEVLNKQRIHALQYLLVGIALCVFYLLLLSLSEHIGFNSSFLAASTAVVLLITAYSRSIFGKNWLAVLLGSILVALYLFLFSLLQLQDYALLLGSLGLFSILAAVMYLSRNIDWYNVGGSKTEEVSE